MRSFSFFGVFAPLLLTLSACQALTDNTASLSPSPWTLLLSHDKDGNVQEGSAENIANAVRRGCQIRVAWGNVRTAPPRRSIEHVAEVKWISVRNDDVISAQIGDFLINLTALGEPPEDHPRRDPFGGVEHVVQWRATLGTDGSFNAVWYKPHSGELATRRPQHHPMKWFADCVADTAPPLYQP